MAEQRAAGSGEEDDVQDERQQPESAHDDRRSVCRAQQSENGKPRMSGRHECVAIFAEQPADVDAGRCEPIIKTKQILIEGNTTGDRTRMDQPFRENDCSEIIGKGRQRDGPDVRGRVETFYYKVHMRAVLKPNPAGKRPSRRLWGVGGLRRKKKT